MRKFITDLRSHINLEQNSPVSWELHKACAVHPGEAQEVGAWYMHYTEAELAFQTLGSVR